MKKECKDNQLNLYLDDELGKSKRSTLDDHVSDCTQCAKKLKLLRLQGDLLREDLALAVEKADFTGFENHVMQKIQQNKPVGLLENIFLGAKELVSQYRAIWVTSLVTAAVLLIVLLPYLSTHPDIDQQIMHPATEDATTPHIAVQAPPLPKDNQLIIDSLEYAGQRSMIFTVSKNNTTVIWLYDFDQAVDLEAGGDDI